MKGRDLEHFRVRHFAPHLYDSIYAHCGCGAIALATLTGENPAFIQNPNKRNKDHWSDSFVVSFLKKREYQVKLLDKKTLLRDEIFSSVTNKHVLLVSHWLNKKNASWAVISHGCYYYHNFEVLPLVPLEFVNRPILTAYAVFHEKWK